LNRREIMIGAAAAVAATAVPVMASAAQARNKIWACGSGNDIATALQKATAIAHKTALERGYHCANLLGNVSTWKTDGLFPVKGVWEFEFTNMKDAA